MTILIIYIYIYKVFFLFFLFNHIASSVCISGERLGALQGLSPTGLPVMLALLSLNGVIVSCDPDVPLNQELREYAYYSKLYRIRFGMFSVFDALTLFS